MCSAYRFSYIFWCLYMSLSCLNFAQAQQLEWQAYWWKQGSDSLPYRMYLPQHVGQDEQLPLLLFLHGAGSRGQDNWLHLTHFHSPAAYIATHYPCIILAPQCPKEHRWVEVDWASSRHHAPQQMSMPLRLVVGLLDSLVQILPIDTNRLYVTGLSMGGYGTWDLIQRYPERFAAAVPICGGADLHQAPSLQHLPIWIFHGALDQIVPVSRAREMYTHLQKVGNQQVRYTEYPNVGHDSWQPAYATPELWRWLFSHTKSAAANR